MDREVAIIGFGEAAAAFVASWQSRPASILAYDSKTDRPATAAAKQADYALARVAGAPTPAAAVATAGLVLSLVTADQALAAARAAAPSLAPGALWCDLNSVAPGTKRAAAAVIEAAGGRYADVAVMSPVHPAGAAAPLLVSGPHAQAALAALRDCGFTNVRVVPGEIGRASAIKMIRSVMIKGIEALTAECMLAADAAGVLDEVVQSLDASPPPLSWHARADYNLERMLAHGQRRAEEMDEVVKTLDALGTGSGMARATAARQRAIGGQCLPPPAGLAAKLDALRPQRREVAA